MDLPATINLRPSFGLLNTKFDGYKLSLDPVPVLKSNLKSPVRRVLTSDDQYSFLHAKLFALHNHLFRDPWQSNSAYFVDEDWNLQNIRYDTNSGALNSVKAVARIPKSGIRNDAYNVSCCFVSEKYCIFSDGCGSLLIFDTGDRQRNEEWKSIHRENEVFDDAKVFVIQDARLEIAENVRSINCLLIHIQPCEKSEKTDKRFEAIIEWISFHKSNESGAWRKKYVRQLKGKSLPEYCILEPKSKAIVLSSDQKFEFTFDSENEIVKDVEMNEIEENNENGIEKRFTWTQTDEDVVIRVCIERESHKNDFKVICDGKKLHILHHNETIFDSELFLAIDNDLTTWNLENDKLIVNLVKKDESSPWLSLLKDSAVPSTEQADSSATELSQYDSRLRTEMEECDYGDDIESEYLFVRLDVVTHRVTHKAILGQNNPILFNVYLRAGQPPAFALRSDVDVCIWLPLFRLGLDSGDSRNNLQVQHEGTLNAFGYIQASKQQKKFIQCAPDFNYSIVCESIRHVFVYKGAYETATGLKNRSTNKKANIGQQKLITLDETDDVIGILCENNFTILLTQREILCLQINS